MENRSAGNRKLILLQTLRGTAALFVVLYHAGGMSLFKLGNPFLNGVFGFGSAGVDFFFVLSGFIIFYIHSKDLGHKGRLKSFITKRLQRIYPIYWLATLPLIPFYFLFPAFGEGYEKNLDVIASSLLLIPQSHPPVLSVGWSLSHEMLFYLCFSLAILLPPRLSLALAWVWGTATLAFSLTLASGFPSPSYLADFFFNARNLEFLAGCLCAYALRRWTLPARDLIAFFGVALFAIAALPGYREMAPLGYVIAYGVPSALILLGCASRDMHAPLKVPAFLDYLGNASYSIYLVHFPLLQVTIKAFGSLGRGSVVGEHVVIFASVGIGILGGCLFHSFVEKPLLQIFKQWSENRQKLEKQFS